MFRTVFRLPFRLIGIPLHVDVTFLVVLPLLAWAIGRNVEAYARLLGLGAGARALGDGWTPWLLGLGAALGLFASVVVHELGHAVVARGYGVRTRRIILWVLGGVAELEDIPRQRGAEAIVAVVGPIVSFALGLVCWSGLGIAPPDAHAARFILGYLALANVVLATFNLLPALPLDGGRALRSLLALRLSRRRATEVSAAVSRVLAVGVGLLGFATFNIFLLLIAFFIFIAVTAETQSVVLADTLRGISVRDLMTRDVRTVGASMLVSDVVHKMVTERHLAYPVIDPDDRVLGVVTVREVRSAEPAARVGNVMQREVAAIGPDATALDALDLMGRTGSGRLPVVDEDGRLRGLLTRTDLIRAVQVRALLDGAAAAAGAAGAARRAAGEEAEASLAPA